MLPKGVTIDELYHYDKCNENYNGDDPHPCSKCDSKRRTACFKIRSHFNEKK